MTLHELMVSIDSMPEDALPPTARVVALDGFDTAVPLEEQKPKELAIAEVIVGPSDDPIVLVVDDNPDVASLSIATLSEQLNPIVGVTPERLVVVKQGEEYLATVTVAANRAAEAFAIVPAFDGFEILFDAPPSGCS
jgi:hypothetical protein